MVWKEREGDYEEKDWTIEEKGSAEEDMDGITKKSNVKKDTDNDGEERIER